MALDDKDKGARSLLAIVITIFSIVGITILSIAYIVVSDKDRQAAASQVFTGVLPLYGTWVGTLLAFYFAKENFDSATQNTVALSQISSPTQANLLDSILVSALTSAKLVSVFNTEENKSLKDLKNELTDNERRRLPILNPDGSLDFLVYYQDIDSYIEKHSPDSTLKQFVGAKEEVKKPVVYVEKNISLAKANEERKKIVDCRDIIVTDTGKPTEKIIGYITDVDIDRFIGVKK